MESFGLTILIDLRTIKTIFTLYEKIAKEIFDHSTLYDGERYVHSYTDKFPPEIKDRL